MQKSFEAEVYTGIPILVWKKLWYVLFFVLEYIINILLITNMQSNQGTLVSPPHSYLIQHSSRTFNNNCLKLIAVVGNNNFEKKYKNGEELAVDCICFVQEYEHSPANKKSNLDT